MSRLPKAYENFKKAYPNIWQAYDRLGAAVHDGGPLDKKTASCSSLQWRSVRDSKVPSIHILAGRSRRAPRLKRSATWFCLA